MTTLSSEIWDRDHAQKWPEPERTRTTATAATGNSQRNGLSESPITLTPLGHP